ncbi:MAG: AIM24 family protein [Clostridia bacterium]|nr:AIM24 family protein [Clostridia bacterium]
MFNPDLSSIVKVLERREGEGIILEVIQYEKLQGHYGGEAAAYRHVNKLHQVRAYLKGGELVTESGALQFMKGAVAMKTDNSLGSIAKGLLGNALTGESSVKPRYTGVGEIYLEPSYKHFFSIELNNEELIADKGTFYCCESRVEVGVYAQKNLSAAIAGGEGYFQTKLRGSGIAVLQSSVPSEQILVYKLNNEKLQVDGNYVIARKGNIEFTVEKSTKSIIGSSRSGEGLLHTYRGTGEVWLIPTLKFVG